MSEDIRDKVRAQYDKDQHTIVPWDLPIWKHKEWNVEADKLWLELREAKK